MTITNDLLKTLGNTGQDGIMLSSNSLFLKLLAGFQ